MSRRRALITGINGQDGSYLAELLLAADYEVYGLIQPADAQETSQLANLDAVLDRIQLIEGRLQSGQEVENAVAVSRPEECYHLAARTSVTYDLIQERDVLEVNVLGTHALLSAVRQHAPECRMFLATSSEVFGNPEQSPQNERTPRAPRSMYGLSKIAVLELAGLYRSLHRMHVSAGILFNHESPRRPQTFVTRKITSTVARIASGDTADLTLGNLDAQRDWGHARDYVRGMYLMLQQPEPSDFVLATGQLRSVRDFCHAAFSCVGLDYRQHTRSDPALFRPAEKCPTVGDATRAKEVLGWVPSTAFEDLVREMVEHDCQIAGMDPAKTAGQA